MYISYMRACMNSTLTLKLYDAKLGPVVAHASDGMVKAFHARMASCENIVGVGFPIHSNGDISFGKGSAYKSELNRDFRGQYCNVNLKFGNHTPS